LDNAPSLSAARAQIDSNEDGKITAKEIADRISEWHDSRMGSQTVNCIVRKGGLPLDGATVTFDPEEFLGTKVQAATGVTDKSGIAGVSMPGSDPPGVAPGLYLVRITKQGEEIPAKYNTETTLGQEVAIDAAQLGFGSVNFELE
jgi:hypothetical protein